MIRPQLQQLCKESLSAFEELSKNPKSGVQVIPILNYFKNEEDFKQSVWAKDSLQKLIKVVDVTDNLPPDCVRNKDFPVTVLTQVPLADATIYRPFLLDKFIQLGGKLEKKEINSLTELAESHGIVINCAGWEAKSLTKDNQIYPVRGQTEIAKVNENLKLKCSLNIKDLNGYVVFRPSGDCVIGTTYQMNDTTKKSRDEDKEAIIKKIAPFFPGVSSLKTESKVGICCGRSDVRVESEFITNHSGKQVLIEHCYGHGGSGFSGSWGSADKVLQHCLSYVQDLQLSSACRSRY